MELIDINHAQLLRDRYLVGVHSGQKRFDQSQKINPNVEAQYQKMWATLKNRVDLVRAINEALNLCELQAENVKNHTTINWNLIQRWVTIPHDLMDDVNVQHRVMKEIQVHLEKCGFTVVRWFNGLEIWWG
jgi:hypothetical protein